MNLRQENGLKKSSPTYDGIYDKTANIGLVLNAENRNNVVKRFLQTYNRYASHKKQVTEMQVVNSGHCSED
ncbi:16074_t:CDS:1, partial [Gigaspora rosea]